MRLKPFRQGEFRHIKNSLYLPFERSAARGCRDRRPMRRTSLQPENPDVASQAETRFNDFVVKDLGLADFGR